MIGAVCAEGVSLILYILKIAMQLQLNPILPSSHPFNTISTADTAFALLFILVAVDHYGRQTKTTGVALARYVGAALHAQGSIYCPRLTDVDGGGIRGMSELIILDEIMHRVQRRGNLSSVPLPADYFDMICGTSTGG